MSSAAQDAELQHRAQLVAVEHVADADVASEHSVGSVAGLRLILNVDAPDIAHLWAPQSHPQPGLPMNPRRVLLGHPTARSALAAVSVLPCRSRAGEVAGDGLAADRQRSKDHLGETIEQGRAAA